MGKAAVSQHSDAPEPGAPLGALEFLELVPHLAPVQHVGPEVRPFVVPALLDQEARHEGELSDHGAAQVLPEREIVLQDQRDEDDHIRMRIAETFGVAVEVAQENRNQSLVFFEVLELGRQKKFNQTH